MTTTPTPKEGTMPKLNWMQRHDAARRASSDLVDQACQRAGLVPPLPGLGVTMTEAAEQVFRVIFYGHELGPARNWVAAAGGSFDSLRRIFDELDAEAIARASEAFGQSVAA